MKNLYNRLNDIDRNNFNPVAVMVALDKLDSEETKRLLEEACYHIADLHNQLNRYLLMVKETTESISKMGLQQ